MKKFTKLVTLVMSLVMAMSLLAACGSAKKEITVTFMNGETKLGEIKANVGEALTDYAQFETVEGYEFQGWFETPTLLASSKKDLTATTYDADVTLYGGFKSLQVAEDTRLWYIVGTGGSKILADSNWAGSVSDEIKAACQLQPTGNATNEFSITLDMFAGDQFQIIHDWGWSDQHGYGYFTSVDETQIANGGGLGGTADTSNANVMVDGNYTITLTTDPADKKQDTMVIVRNGDPKAGQATYTANDKTQVFVKGSWVSDWSENKELNRTAGTNEFTIEMTLDAGTEVYFMIWENDADTGYGMKGENVTDAASKAVLEEGYNIKVKDAGTYVFTVDAGAMTVKVEKK